MIKTKELTEDLQKIENTISVIEENLEVFTKYGLEVKIIKT